MIETTDLRDAFAHIVARAHGLYTPKGTAHFTRQVTTAHQDSTRRHGEILGAPVDAATWPGSMQNSSGQFYFDPAYGDVPGDPDHPIRS